MGKLSKEEMQKKLTAEVHFFPSDLEKMFYNQIRTLKQRGCPPEMLEKLKNQRYEVIEKARTMKFRDGHIPFLPVMPKTYLSVFTQMPMVRYKNKVGYAYLDHSIFTNPVKTPAKPYYIFDVEDGRGMLGKTPEDAKKLIKNQRRRGLTEVEVISLGIHTDVLSRHSVNVIGSCDNLLSNTMIPLLLVGRGDGRPKFILNHLCNAHSNIGTPSCARH